MKQRLASARLFVEQHRVALAVTATALSGLAVNRFALRQHDDFLKEHDLYDEFYSKSE